MARTARTAGGSEWVGRRCSAEAFDCAAPTARTLADASWPWKDVLRCVLRWLQGRFCDGRATAHALRIRIRGTKVRVRAHPSLCWSLRCRHPPPCRPLFPRFVSTVRDVAIDESPCYCQKTNVLVVGGGPAGSYAAAALAREGIDVVLLEAAQFPRYHIGESLIPSVRHYLRFIGAEEKAASHGFARKPGSAIKFNQYMREGYTDFVALGADNAAWNVNRKFNEALRNVAVWGYWRGAGMYGVGTTRENAPWFEALSDESGWAWFIPLHNGLTSVGVVMSQKILGARSRASSNASAPACASPGGGARHGHGGSPLAGRAASTLAPRYLAFLQLAPGVLRLLGGGELVCVDEESMCVFEGDGEAPPAVRSTSDFSYSADTYAGDGFRVVGDAGAFIDPFFSSGVHLAMTGGLAAAASIAASVRGDCTEAEAASWHSSRIAISYTRFLVVVLSAYKQIHAQSTNVLADIEEDNFDKAFAFLRPVIQGGAEMGARLSEDELQQALDFCVHLFSPTSPEQHEAVRQKLQELQREDSSLEGLGADLLDVRAPLIDPARLDAVSKRRPQRISTGAPTSRGLQSAGNKDADVDSEVKMVLDKVNARRVIYSEHGNGLHSMEGEAVDGFVVRLEKGRLGLRKAGAEDGLVVRGPLDTALNESLT
ncbi:FAD/NAD(P)-binding domain-containing protein [Wolfiporia cocos MD-104 SS10]|uniref:FAD/NAD(P)-binding domain-containing protein n=1 Tax=Wolfiporia cocos (strain MD-104) TaxID=742152 RepID=A0A2H3J4W8_WOLCO|nr:FAD/NAD(P)-binding domain-containing protein [Wolfiporia cocos MD-104 SS10]